MLNPSQTNYSPVELFTLKPAPVKLEAVPMIAEYGGKIDINNTALELLIDNRNFLSKYKWIIIGGVLVAGGICWIVYKKNQKDNSTQNN